MTCQHRYAVTFDNTTITGMKREKCVDCGGLRWTIDGKVREWVPNSTAEWTPTPTTPPASDRIAAEPGGEAVQGANERPAQDTHRTS